MSTLIAYSSKYGCTQRCAELLAQKLHEKPDICNLDNSQPDLGKYDKVIIGGSVYAGRIRKSTARFCSDNLNILKGKKLGLFICGMSEGDQAQALFQSSFPLELLSVSAVREFFGGEFDFGKMNFLERFIVKKISGSDQNQSRILKENITRFAGQFNSL